jgi:poly(A) polymerase
MLVARICQLYPNACAATVVSRFFRVYARWQWPAAIELRKVEDENMGFQIWDVKRNMGDKRALMPIITPAYPSQNSTHNTGLSTLAVMKAEFTRGDEIMNKIEAGQEAWPKLFDKTDFFWRYKHFLRVEASAETQEDHHAWAGLVEGRALRYLVQGLERCPEISVACPFPKGYDVCGWDGMSYRAHGMHMGPWRARG